MGEGMSSVPSSLTVTLLAAEQAGVGCIWRVERATQVELALAPEHVSRLGLVLVPATAWRGTAPCGEALLP
jgi:hypothetical protein